MKYRYFTAIATHSGQHWLFRGGTHPNYYRLNRFMPYNNSWTLTDWTFSGLKSYSHWSGAKEIPQKDVDKYIMLMELSK